MTDITLTDNERAALEALWRAGGEMALKDMPRDLRSAFVELDVKGATLMVRQRKGDFIVVFTAEGRALATELFTPPLTMPTDEGAVRAWLEARGLWVEGDSIRVDKRFGDLDTIVLQSWLTVEYEYCGRGMYLPTVHKRRISNAAVEAQFRADFDRACAIARALNANSERGE